MGESTKSEKWCNMISEKRREELIDTHLDMSEEKWQWHLYLVRRYDLMHGNMKEDIEAVQMLRDFREDSI